ncbi:PEPT1-like protein [Mya arenaria]|uniref:PEPT1-like protein n=1 Tax=Mya arenaria TaxID=6604 RepID=A0ABY7EJR5_MYAAR|nr:PEPT1-like protein [Mya arenaria]
MTSLPVILELMYAQRSQPQSDLIEKDKESNTKVKQVNYDVGILETILVLYLTRWLGFGDAPATSIFHAWSMMCYFMPLIGAVVADGYLGRYSIGPSIGLFLIACGTGGIKASVAPFGADQFVPGQEKWQNSFFSAFYFMINLGSLFFMGRNQYTRVPPTGDVIGKTFKCIFGSRWTLQAEHMDGSMGIFGKLKPDQMQALNPLLILIMIPILDKIVYPFLDKCRIPNRPLQRMKAEDPALGAGQTGITFLNTLPCNVKVTSPFYEGNVLSLQMSDFLDRPDGHYRVKVESLCGKTDSKKVEQVFNFADKSSYRVIVYETEDKALKIGQMSLTLYVDLKENTVSMLWLVPQYILITVGEVLFSVAGISFAYSQAPNSMKSVVQAMWLSTTALGDLVVIIVANIHAIPSQMAEFYLFAILMFIDTVIFMIMSFFYNYKPNSLYTELPDELTIPTDGLDNTITDQA